MASDQPSQPNQPTQTHVSDVPDEQLQTPLRVLVLGDGLSETYPLGEDSVIGRATDVQIPVNHRSVSRKHALLRVGPPIEIEDLGSANGTRVAGQQLQPGARTTINPGEVVEIGELVLVVQGGTATRPRRLWVHGYFETRLEGECERSRQTGAPLAVIRLSCRGEHSATEIEEALWQSVHVSNVIGYYAPDEYEVLLLDTREAAAVEVASRLEHALAQRGIEVRVGLACFPKTARSAAALLAEASSLARGGGSPGAGAMLRGGAVANLHRLLERVAPSDLSLLILGETGVGKEVMAEQIHQMSRRKDGPLLKLNCAALAETLLESELFGHERGAFSGAVQTKPGLLESANGGTVFLDEIGELSGALQAKLLRVLEDRSVMRVGGLKPQRVDVRFVAATNRDLEAAVASGAFRADLYYRLNGATLQIPPLRERLDELEPLVNHFLAEAARSDDDPAASELTPEAWELLRSYSWPGNIRELRNFIERAVLLSYGEPIGPEHLPREKIAATSIPDAARGIDARVTASAELQVPPGQSFGSLMKAEIRAVERKYIMAALSETGGNQAEAAALIGVSRRTLQYRIKTLDIRTPRSRSRPGTSTD